jgi:xylulokinase
VNHAPDAARYGILLCINGTGIQNSWLKHHVAGNLGYDGMNAAAAGVPVGAEGLVTLPFGNGAERVLENKQLGGSVHGLDFNRHSAAHLFRSAQEGIVFALNYGFDIMNHLGCRASTVRAGDANMFLSPLFGEAFAATTGATVELYNTDGARERPAAPASGRACTGARPKPSRACAPPA